MNRQLFVYAGLVLILLGSTTMVWYFISAHKKLLNRNEELQIEVLTLNKLYDSLQKYVKLRDGEDWVVDGKETPYVEQPKTEVMQAPLVRGSIPRGRHRNNGQLPGNK